MCTSQGFINANIKKNPIICEETDSAFKTVGCAGTAEWPMSHLLEAALEMNIYIVQIPPPVVEEKPPVPVSVLPHAHVFCVALSSLGQPERESGEP